MADAVQAVRKKEMALVESFRAAHKKHMYVVYIRRANEPTITLGPFNSLTSVQNIANVYLRDEFTEAFIQQVYCVPVNKL